MHKQPQKIESIDGQILKSFTFLKKKEFDKALSLVNDILNSDDVSLSIIQEFNARVMRSQALISLKRYDEVSEEIKLCDQTLYNMDENERENPIVKMGEGSLLFVKGAIKTLNGDLEGALEHYYQSLAIYKALGNKKFIFYQLDAIGWTKRAQGDLDQALEYFHKQLDLARQIGDERYIAWAMFSTAFAYFYRGDLDDAAEFAEECLALYKKLNHSIGKSWGNCILGSINRGKGELTQALEYYNKALTIYDENLANQEKVPHSYCYALRNIGEIRMLQNRIQESIEYYKKAIASHYSFCAMKNTLFDYEILAIHLLLIMSSLEIDNVEQIDNSMNELSKYAREWPWAELFRKCGKALILKNKKRAKYKIQAQLILEELLKEKFDYELEFIIQVSLCELLIEELKYSGGEEILGEIQDLLYGISNVANKQRSIGALVKLYSLQARLALIEGNAELSNKILSKALSIAKNKGLGLQKKYLKAQQTQVFNQLEEWKDLFMRNSKLQEKIEFLNLRKHLTKAIDEVLEKKFKIEKKYELIYKDLVKEYAEIQETNCRVGVAQIDISTTGDIIEEFYEIKSSDLLGIREDKIEAIRTKVENIIENAYNNGVNILLFPEMTLDLNYDNLVKDISRLAESYGMYIVPGSYHDQETRRNISIVFGPEGILWEQEKHIPAIIHFGEKKFKEAIEVGITPRETIVCNTEYGRIAIAICRDFLDMDLRVELKNFEPPVDIILNPAFTPVTADFKAAHFDARRSIYAYCFFANVAEFGDSLIYTPEKERIERTIPSKEEGLIYKDVDIFKLRSERKKWEKEQKKEKSFIQSTR